jgi:hypothetical protein
MMRKLSNPLPVILSLLFAISFLMPARAQGEVKLSSLGVDLWPEYDKPTVLVIYHITLPASITLPVDLSFRIPAAAGEPSAVAVRQMTAEGQPSLFTIPYKRQVNGEWGVISLTATMPEVQLEYYDPGLVKQDEARQFEYRWPGDYAVDSLNVQVQQPVGASEMSLSPASGAAITGNDGLAYFKKDVGALKAGQAFSLKVNYKKSGDELSAASLQIQPSAPVTSITPGQNTVMSILPWLLGALGLALIGGGGAWYYFSGRKKQENGSRPPRRRRSAAQAEPEEVEGFIYCHQCGKRASPGDRFCRTCGSKLRVE